MKRTLDRLLTLLPDRMYIALKYWYHFKKLPHLHNPKTYNEKLQWLKLHDRENKYTQMVDKCEAKKYIESVAGAEYVIPTLGVWNHYSDIDFSKLPQRFVLKCTHDSGGVFVCKNKNDINHAELETFFEEHLSRNYFYEGREWPYKNVKPRIIAEEYLEDSKSSDLKDYKVFVFNGKSRLIFIASERQSEDEETKFDFYDTEFKDLNIQNGHPNANRNIEKPQNFQEMLDVAEKLAHGIAHLRVDFYVVDEKLYVGELTFSHWSGFIPFDPPEWDQIIGDWLDLSTLK